MLFCLWKLIASIFLNAVSVRPWRPGLVSFLRSSEILDFFVSLNASLMCSCSSCSLLLFNWCMISTYVASFPFLCGFLRLFWFTVGASCGIVLFWFTVGASCGIVLFWFTVGASCGIVSSQRLQTGISKPRVKWKHCGAKVGKDVCGGTLFWVLKVVNLCIFPLLFYLQNYVNQCGDTFIRPIRCLWQNLGDCSDLLCLLHTDKNCAVNQERLHITGTICSVPWWLEQGPDLCVCVCV